MKQKRATLGIVFLIVFIDLVGFGIVIPILPLYAELYSPGPLVFGLFMASFSIMQFIFAPILGRLSDRFGRRPVLMVSLCGSVIGYLMFGFAGSFWVLFLSRVIDGISGANISTAQAVMADISNKDERAKAMGMIGAAFGLGFILGPAIGGTLVHFAMWLPGVAAAAMSALALVLVIVRLPETRAETSPSAVKRGMFDFTLLRRTLSHRQLALCMAQILIVIFAFANFETTFAQFARARHSLTIPQISYLFVFAGVMGAIVQGGLVGRLAKRFGEVRLVVVGSAL
ncbi:MAG: TCR/Tet family MFS transporter, partial [bacterium]|nr:TCR/Tet family MFS transporter [bacterium]